MPDEARMQRESTRRQGRGGTERRRERPQQTCRSGTAGGSSRVTSVAAAGGVFSLARNKTDKQFPISHRPLQGRKWKRPGLFHRRNNGY